MALGYSDFVVTEAGFGADLGFEKFMHIKARFNDLEPSAVVLVSTVRAVKSHGGVRFRELDTPNEGAVEKGVANVEHDVELVRAFGLPVVVAINRFPTDTPGEVAILKSRAEAAGAEAAVESNVFESGGAGGVDLARAVADAASGDGPQVTYLYPEDAGIQDKVKALATKVYGAASVTWDAAARRKVRRFEALGWGGLPVCMAKTHLSLSDKPRLKARPSGYTFEVNDVRASIGAGFIYPVAGTIVTMPGLPGSPRALDVDEEGNILGL